MINLILQSLLALLVIFSPIYIYISITSFRYYVVKNDSSEIEIRAFLDNLNFLSRKIYSIKLHDFLTRRKNSTSIRLLVSLRIERIAFSIPLAIASIGSIAFNIQGLLQGYFIETFYTFFGIGLLLLLLLSWHFGIELEKES